MGTEPPLRPSAGPFTPSRMQAARLRRGFTLNDLSEAMGLHRSTSYRHDVGEFAPKEKHLRAAARALRFPERFFLGDDIGELAQQTVSFRSPSKLTARQRDMALGSAAVAVAFNQAIERLYSLPKVELPDVFHRTSPEHAAETVRWRWHLDEGPIERVMQLLESHGVRIFSLPADASASDSFSIWHQGQPFVFLDPMKGKNGLRLDLAHELGHLLLRRAGAPASPKTRRAAGAFAFAFLMPAAAMRAGAAHPSVLGQLISLAQKWGAPPTAVAQRLHGLGLLSDWQYRKLLDDITARNTADSDAPDAQRDNPMLLQRIFDSLRGRGITKQKLPHAVHIYAKDLDELTFGLALAGLEGRSISDRIEPLRPCLALVSSAK